MNEPTGKIARALRRAPLSIVELDGDLQVLDWNDGAARIFGYSREDSVGRCLTDLLSAGGDADAFRRWIQEGDDLPRAWTHARKKDGSAVTCTWSRQPVLDDGGETTGVLCFAQEMTEANRSPPQRDALFQAILDNMGIAVFTTDPSGIFTFNDGKGGVAAGIQPGQLVGANILQMYADHPDVGMIRRALEGESAHKVVEAQGMYFEDWYIPICDERGKVTSLIGVAYDVTGAKRVELELRDKLAIIERQQEVIRNLSTPIIQVWDGVLALPMIGVVDSVRTAEIMNKLLDAVVANRARYVILDLTGVDTVDTKTARYLIELVQAIRLLGAEGIIAGIRPTVAQTVVTLGLDLSGVVTLANLRAALRHCVVQMRARPDAPRPG